MKVRGRNQRKQRIDIILERAALCGDDVNWDEVPGVWKGRKCFKKRKSAVKNTHNVILNSRINVDVTSEFEDFCSLSLNQEEHTQLEFEQLEVGFVFLF